ncbi:MAG TPA: hypothetical protein VL356_12855 [Acidocella sp.]|nr:hypothetical protein [Acidocella sp.]
MSARRRAAGTAGDSAHRGIGFAGPNHGGGVSLSALELGLAEHGASNGTVNFIF